jgi:hypothetical protein
LIITRFFKEFEAVEAKITKTREIVTGVKATMVKVPLEGPVAEIWGGLLAALESIIDTQVTMSSALMDGLSVKNPVVGRREPVPGPTPAGPKGCQAASDWRRR